MSALILWRSLIWRLVKRRKLCVCSKKVSQSATSCCRACSAASKWISASILCAKIRVSRNWSSVSTREFQNEPGKLLLRAEAAQRPSDGGTLSRRGMAGRASSRDVLPMFGAPEWLPRAIVVLMAIGFVPAVIFSWVFELTPQGLKRDEDVAPERSITPQTGRRMDRTIIVALVLALGYFAFDKFVLTPRREAALVASALPNESRSAINAKSIAVLPFENRSRDPDNAYFADGIQDEILTGLAKIADLKVISRTSVMQYKSGVARNLRKIGEELGVAHVVEGSVQRAAN